MGAKNAPRYRLVVADVHAKRDGRFLEAIGHYDPTTKPAQYQVNEERALYWLSVGATPSATARSIMSKLGIMKKFAEDKAARGKAA